MEKKDHKMNFKMTKDRRGGGRLSWEANFLLLLLNIVGGKRKVRDVDEEEIKERNKENSQSVGIINHAK